jgi:hypothetical protein
MAGEKLPDKLLEGIRKLSGAELGDVRVHYNSAKPAQLQAQACTEGNDIYLAPGQERHLPHEAWHVVQQKQGRVSEKGRSHIGLRGVPVNDDAALEREADAMGAKALEVERDLLAKRTPL